MTRSHAAAYPRSVKALGTSTRRTHRPSVIDVEVVRGPPTHHSSGSSVLREYTLTLLIRSKLSNRVTNACRAAGSTAGTAVKGSRRAAAVGAMLAFLLALFRRRVNQKSTSRVLLQTIRTTCLAFFILIGAHIFNPFMALTDIPSDLASLLLDANLPRTAIMLIIMLAYIVLGTFLEGFAMLVLTLPIIHPLIVELGYDPIWFGVVIVIVIEMGLISPPVGVNVFVVKGIAEDVPLREIFAGIIPFWIAMAVCLVILLAFPEIALFLPDTMIQSFD